MKRSGSPLASSQEKKPLIKAEKTEDVKIDLSSIPMKDDASKAPEFSTPSAKPFKPFSRRKGHGPPCVKVHLGPATVVLVNWDKREGLLRLKSCTLPADYYVKYMDVIVARLGECGFKISVDCASMFTPPVNPQGFTLAFRVTEVPPSLPASDLSLSHKTDSPVVKKEESSKENIKMEQIPRV